MDKHTSGPWKAEDIAGQIHIGTDADDDQFIFGQQIADMVQSIGRGRKDVRRIVADAHLIAAAPDLLAACKQAVKLAGTPHRRAQMIRDLKAAIAKAEGR